MDGKELRVSLRTHNHTHSDMKFLEVLLHVILFWGYVIGKMRMHWFVFPFSLPPRIEQKTVAPFAFLPD